MTKLNELPSTSTTNDNDLVLIQQGGSDKQITKSDFDTVTTATGTQTVAGSVDDRVIKRQNVAAAVATPAGIGTVIATNTYAGSGGGNRYEVVAGGTGTADGGSFIDMTNGNQLKALFEKEADITQFGALPGSGNDATNAIKAWRDFIKGGEYTGTAPSGSFRITDEIDFSGNFDIRFTSPNNYGDGGTEILVDVNDITKTGFYFGKTLKAMKAYFYHCRFKPLSTCFASMREESATFFGGDYIFDSNTNTGNGLYIDGSYIGEIDGVEGTGKDYLFKVTGNTSLVLRNFNCGSSNIGSPTGQISDMSDGLLRLRDFYLEAQTRPNLSITDCNERSNIVIDGVYEENSAVYAFKIDNSNCVKIRNWRTNIATKGAIVSASKMIDIEVLAMDRLERNPVVVNTDNSDVSVSVLHNRDDVAPDDRQYTLVEGQLSGPTFESSTINSKLTPSANGSNMVVMTNGTIVSTTPTDHQKISDTSISLAAGNSINVPLRNWTKNHRYLIKAVLQCSNASQTASQIEIFNGSTSVKTFQSYNESTAGFRTLYFVFTAPNVDITEFSSLRLLANSGTTVLHYLGMAEYGHGSLPAYLDDGEVLFQEVVDLSVTGLTPLYDSSQKFKVSRYEMQYMDTPTAGAAVRIGNLSSGLVHTSFAEFTSSALNTGALEGTLSVSTGNKDTLNREANGVAVNITTAATGKAKVKVWASPCSWSTSQP